MARVKLPPFLEGTKVGTKRVEELTDTLSNWLKCHGVISVLPATRDSLTTLKEMLYTEYHRSTGPRMDIIVRLHGRYTKLRYEVERVELATA